MEEKYKKEKMNYQEKLLEKKRIKELFRSNYSKGCIKITMQESELHARVKVQLAHFLLVNDFEVWSECSFKSGGRADIVALHSSGISYAFEVLNTESLGEFYKKTYPLDTIPVIAKEFDYDTFKI